MGRRHRDFDSDADVLFLKEDHHRSSSRKAVGKKKGTNGKLSAAEQDYVNNVGEDEMDCLALNEDDLINTLDQLDFTPVENDQTVAAGRALRQEQMIDTESYYLVTNFRQLNRDIKLFLKDDDEELFETAPASGVVRKFVHELGNIYRLKTCSVETKDEKRVVLQKTEQSGLPANARELDKIVENGDKALKWSRGNRDKPSKHSVVKSQSARPTPGQVVGERSAPIQDDNVGNKMLQKMGWMPGTGLGRDSAGITQPIAAIVKTKRSGLA